jgi:Rod binding domain-containing protein
MHLSEIYRKFIEIYRKSIERLSKIKLNSAQAIFLRHGANNIYKQANYFARFFKSVVLRFMRTTITAYLCPLNTLQTTEPFTNVHTCSVPSCILHGGICGNTF